MSKLESECIADVFELHELIEVWLQGSANDKDEIFTRMTNRLDEQFRLVLPSGFILDRSGLLEGLKGSYGTDGPSLAVTIVNPVARQVAENLCLVTYEEHQSDRPDNKRLSSALIEKREAHKSSLFWLHLHETWKASE